MLRLSIFLVALASIPGEALAIDRFVSPRGTDTANDCSSSAAPCRTLAHALGQAGAGDVVKLAIGTHRTNALVDLPATLTVSGGWTSGFTKQDAPRKTPRTRLDGRKLDRVLALDADAETIDVTLENLTVLRGQSSTALPGVGLHGGGILATARNGGTLSLTLRNVAVMRNQTTKDFPISGGGLGVFGHDASSVTVLAQDASFSNNVAEHGGAISVVGAGNVSLQLERTALRSNVARSSGRGGAIALDRLADPGFTTMTIDAGLLEKNRAHEGAALSLRGAVTATLVNTVARDNRAPFGVVSVDGEPLVPLPELTVSSSTLLTASKRQPPPIPLRIVNGTVTVRSSIVWSTGAAVLLHGGGVLDLDHSDVGGIAFPGVPGVVNDFGGNISADPQLVRANGSDVHLKATSPCVNAGTCVGAPPVDFEGDPRPVGAECDIGADERVS